MSQISLMFFLSEKERLGWTYLVKKTPWRTKLLISPVWNKSLKIWDTLLELIQVEVQCSKNYLKIFLSQDAGFLGKQRKRTTEATPKIKKRYFLNIYKEYLFCLQSNVSGSFLQTCINFVEQILKFSHFEGRIIP